jgi:hypothetical protein
MRVIAVSVLAMMLGEGCTTLERREDLSYPRELTGLIDRLVVAPGLDTMQYVEDGAADRSISEKRGLEDVEAFFQLGPRAVPLLIDHLDDARLTHATFEGGLTGERRLRVPVGFLCLDLLISLVEKNEPMFSESVTGDDGLAESCSIHFEYFFRPDDYRTTGSEDEWAPRSVVYWVKSNWRRAYTRGQVRPRVVAAAAQ